MGTSLKENGQWWGRVSVDRVRALVREVEQTAVLVRASRNARMNELAYASAKEIGRLVRAREVSPVEIVDYFLGRIEDRNRSLNAFVFVDADGSPRACPRSREGALFGSKLLDPCTVFQRR